MARSVPKPLALGGGVNLLSDPRFVRDDQCVRSKNLVPTRAGMAAKRGAMDTITAGASLSGGVTPYYFSLMALPPGAYGNGLVLASRRFDGGALGTYLTVTTPPPFAALAEVGWQDPSPRRPLVHMYNKAIDVFAGPGNIITLATPAGGVPAVGFPGARISEIGGSIVVNGFSFRALLGGAATEPNAVPRVAAVYRNRTLWANFGAGLENYAVMSDPYYPEVVGVDFLSAAGRNFFVGARDGDEIVAAREALLTGVGSPSESALLVLRQYSSYLITGQPNLVADGAMILGDMEVNRINVDCGCSSDATLVNTPYGLLWAGWDDVWMFPQGQGIPIRVGSHIRPILQATPPELRYLWHASYFDGFYRLHLLTPGQNEGDRTAPGEEWRLDLRNGPPRSHEDARWYGPMIYLTPDPTVGDTDDDEPGGSPDETRDAPPTYADPGVSFAIADTRPGIVPRLIGSSRGGSQFFFVQFEIAAERDMSSLDMTTVFGAGTYIQDTEILLDWRGKEDDLGDPIVEKGYAGTELNMWCNRLFQLTVEDSIDGGASLESASEALPQVGFDLNIDLLDTNLLDRQFQSVKVDAGESSRPTGLTHQFRLYDAAGYVISDANNAPRVQVTSSTVGVPTGTHTLTIASGLYDTKGALITALLAQLTALGGSPSWTSNHTVSTNYVNPISIEELNTQWTILFDTEPSRQFWAALGFDPAASWPAGTLQVAGEVVPVRQSAVVEIARANALVWPFRRRAT